jgi:MFS family permease
MVSELGTWMQYVALGWVARELTSNTLLISIVFAVQWLPYLLLSPVTGVIADRLDRRKIIFWGNIAMILPALALGLLIQTDRLTMLWLIVLVTLGGAAQACTRPAGMAFIPALVPDEDLHSAVSLNAGMSSSTRVIGPAIGGVLVSSWGVAWGFHINAASFLAVSFACLAVRTRVPKPAPTKTSVGEEMKLGIAYLRDNRAAMRIVVLMMAITFPLMQSGLMSIMARDVLRGDAKTYGLLSAGPGFGFVVAAVLTATLTTDHRRTIWIFFTGAGTGVSLVIIGLSRSIPLTTAGMALFGACFMTVNTLASTLLLATSDDEYRGRVMGLFGMVSTGVFAINSVLGGAIASVIGAPFTIWLCGVTVLIAVAGFAYTGTLQVIREGLEVRARERAQHDAATEMLSATEMLCATDTDRVAHSPA